MASRRPIHVRLTLPLLLLAVLGLTAPVAADPLPPMSPAARAHVEAAQRHFAAKNYAAAAREISAAQALAPRPDLYYALGQAQRLGGDCEAAVTSYRAFLESGPPARQAASARENIDRCQAMLRLRTASLGGTSQPAPAEPPAEPPATAPAPRHPEPGPSPWYTDLLGDALCIGGLVALTTGTILWRVGHDAVERANASATYDDYLREADGAEAMQTGGVVTMTVGVGLVAAGVARFLLRPGASRERPSSPAGDDNVETAAGRIPEPSPAPTLSATPWGRGAMLLLRQQF